MDPHALYAAHCAPCCSQGVLNIPITVSVNFFFQLLEGVGAISAAEGRKARSRSGNYQDSVTEPLRPDREDNTDAVGRYDEDGQDSTSSDSIPSAVEKARTNV